MADKIQRIEQQSAAEGRQQQMLDAIERRLRPEDASAQSLPATSEREGARSAVIPDVV